MLSKDKIIVLDLDQTLIATQDEFKDLLKFGIIHNPEHLTLRQRIYYFELFNNKRKSAGISYDYWGVTRPHTSEFLTFCSQYFKRVIIWSAGKRDYVHHIVNYLFRNLPKPDAILTYDDVDIKGTSQKPIIEKPITKLMKLYPDLGITHENTLFLDDNPTTFFHNKNNAIHISEYNPPLTIKDFYKHDDVLVKLIDWLLKPEVIDSKDVKTLDKSHIF